MLDAPLALPFDPTLDRVFTWRDTLRLYFRAVPRGTAPLTATISAFRADGTVALTFERVLNAGSQPHLDISLPLAQLAPGAYRLQVVLIGGDRRATRDLAFVVR